MRVDDHGADTNAEEAGHIEEPNETIAASIAWQEELSGRPSIEADELIAAIENSPLEPGDLLLVRKDQCIGQILAGLDLDEEGRAATFHHVAVYAGMIEGEHHIIHVRFGPAPPCVRLEPITTACERENWTTVQGVRLADDAERAAMLANARADVDDAAIGFAAVDTLMVMIALLWIAARWQHMRAPAARRQVLMLAAGWAMSEQWRRFQDGSPPIERTAAAYFAGDGGSERVTCSEAVCRWMAPELRDQFMRSAYERRAPSLAQIDSALAELDADRPGDASVANQARSQTAEEILEAFRQIREPSDEDPERQCVTLIGLLNGLCGEGDDQRPLGSVVRDVAAAIYGIHDQLSELDEDAFREGGRLVEAMMWKTDTELAQQYADLLPDFVTPGDFERAAAEGVFDIVFDLPA